MMGDESHDDVNEQSVTTGGEKEERQFEPQSVEGAEGARSVASD
jgi:hypothetical protein